MKKLLLFSISLFFGLSTLNAQCDAPTSASPLAYCGGVTSVPLEAAATPALLTYTLDMIDSFGDGWNGASVSLFANGTLILNEASITGASGSSAITFPEGSVITATWVSGAWNGEISWALLDENSTVVNNGGFGATIDYTTPSDTYTLNWYDAAGGTLLGSGSPFEAVGTTVMPTASTGSYSFFVTSTGLNCTESAAVEVVVDVTDVNVGIEAQDVSCIGNTDGTFAITTVECGTPPFSFSVDGGAFGPAPTDLAAGTYSVIVEDGALLQSAAVNVTVGTPPTVVPGPPNADTLLAYCSGSASIPLEAEATG
ncbi:MAG: hypothetical protein P8H94_08150, partial [Crocinitomicaceae bacterium]|nr:hypothetical protein [Crocinitomicaceae bacterium]